MSAQNELLMLNSVLSSRISGLKICNDFLEGEVEETLRGLVEALRDREAELISRLQTAIAAVMERG